jgi:SAM-dependent methyltransferase
MSADGREGWSGWDEYAAFYDWENARTFGRRDLLFWRRLVAEARPPVLELGCGTGRVLAPIARSGVRAIGVDRSEGMLKHAVERLRWVPRAKRPSILRADIRAVPLESATVGVVIAAYGLLQSLLDDRDLNAMLAEVSRVLKPRGVAAFDLVPDLLRWQEYSKRVRFRGRSRRGAHVTLVESVRQLPAKALTVFDETFIERTGGRERRHTFSLTFRSVPLSTVLQRLTEAGLDVEAVCGDYRGGLWTAESDACVIVARRRSPPRAPSSSPDCRGASPLQRPRGSGQCAGSHECPSLSPC